MKFSDGNHNRSDVSVRGSFGLSIPKDLTKYFVIHQTSTHFNSVKRQQKTSNMSFNNASFKLQFLIFNQSAIFCALRT